MHADIFQNFNPDEKGNSVCGTADFLQSTMISFLFLVYLGIFMQTIVMKAMINL